MEASAHHGWCHRGTLFVVIVPRQQQQPCNAITTSLQRTVANNISNAQPAPFISLVLACGEHPPCPASSLPLLQDSCTCPIFGCSAPHEPYAPDTARSRYRAHFRGSFSLPQLDRFIAHEQDLRLRRCSRASSRASIVTSVAFRRPRPSMLTSSPPSTSS